ncbi:hypothetical protein H4Q82_03655 [Pectobacterium carotovorum subsp. carotovorum]|uniref:hypothetical protein n=1 Tax=Pectobacterium carotovorum TaxID=554 RepID=UPI001602E6C1|nr:hypothetical protein [Pectobacterium carotovorum]MBB1525592.1 hypothetical protein [Pectobacterium carotovorum subsp. carotovorum]MCA6964669.1 hypothetical protein [Pectobacterium carotovorum]MCH4987102.1 hypothetical protein [Pectobacterium carotovorum]
MQSYVRAKSMHQFYRDVFTRDIYLGDTGNIPLEIIDSVIKFFSCDALFISRELVLCDSGLSLDNDNALKQLLVTIAHANMALDEKWSGYQKKLPDDYVFSIRNSLMEILKLNPNIEYLIVAIQILFRIGDIESSVSLINNNFSSLKNSPAAFRILLMICVIEEDYELALPLIKEMTSNQHLIGEDFMVLLMVVCTIYKLGGYPDSYIDFSSLLDKDVCSISSDNYDWVISKNHQNKKTTILIACDIGYYYEHAIPALYSIYEKNRENFNVHFHVYNIDEEVSADINRKKEQFPELNLSCTSECFSNFSAMNVHYASRRFIFASYALDLLDTPLLILDADCLLRKDWLSSIHVQSFDLVLTTTESAPFWENVSAGFVYLGGGEASKNYINRVASFIHANLANNNSVWFLDQVALSASLDYVKNKDDVFRINSSFVCDISHTDYSFMWVVTTMKNVEGKYSSYKKYLIDKYTVN